jgi:tetratricopeptide (TPR) repeat protein
MIRKPALCACLLLGTASAALGQSMQEHLNECMSVDPDTRIAACTAIIQAPVLDLMAHLHVGKASENLSTIYNNRGTAYNSKGDHDRAIQDFSEAIRLSPNHGYTYRNRGIDYYEKGDYDRAIQDFNEAIHLDPNDTSAYFSRGDAYNNKGDYNRAIQDFNEAIRMDPNHARAYYSRGQADSRKGDHDRAIQDFSEAIRLSPKFAYSYEKRGDAYFFQSNLTAAIVNFKDTISAAPSSSAAVYAALMLHVAMKRQGQDDAQQLASVAAAADLSKWPGPVLKLDLGQITADEVIVAAASGDIQKWQICEANYFTGEDALFHHQRTTAMARLGSARDGCPKDDTLYDAALVELRRLGAPAAPTK